KLGLRTLCSADRLFTRLRTRNHCHSRGRFSLRYPRLMLSRGMLALLLLGRFLVYRGPRLRDRLRDRRPGVPECARRARFSIFPPLLRSLVGAIGRGGGYTGFRGRCRSTIECARSREEGIAWRTPAAWRTPDRPRSHGPRA